MSSKADFTPERGTYKDLTPFRYWCQKVLPLVYDDALSYYELLSKVLDYLNKTMEDVNTLHEDVDNLFEAYELLQTWVNDYTENYFEGEGFIQDLDAALDRMVASGEFGTIVNEKVASQINAVVASQIGGTVANQLPEVVEDQIGGTVAGQLPGVVNNQLPPVAEAWLNANINPGSNVLDSSLSIPPNDDVQAKAPSASTISSVIDGFLGETDLIELPRNYSSTHKHFSCYLDNLTNSVDPNITYKTEYAQFKKNNQLILTHKANYIDVNGVVCMPTYIQLTGNLIPPPFSISGGIMTWDSFAKSPNDYNAEAINSHYINAKSFSNVELTITIDLENIENANIDLTTMKLVMLKPSYAGGEYTGVISTVLGDIVFDDTQLSTHMVGHCSTTLPDLNYNGVGDYYGNNAGFAIYTGTIRTFEVDGNTIGGSSGIFGKNILATMSISFKSISNEAKEIANLKADLDNLDNRFSEFETDSNNRWINTYGTVNGVTFTPNGHGGFKVVGTATAPGTLRYTFETPITLTGYRLQFKQAKNESGKMLIRCRNASATIVRNLPADGLSGFSVDSATTAIKYLDITVLSGALLDTELYISLTETTAETVLYPQKIVNAYYSKFADFIGEPTVDIDFWGDSLTRGYGGNGVTFPNTCATIMGATYRNLGHGGETANTISAREGGNAWIIPAGAVNGDYTLANMNDVYGGKVTPLRQIIGDATATTIYVNGLPCTLTRKSQASPVSDDVVYTVSGYTGSALTVPTPCRFIGGDYKAKIAVIFVGTNGQTVGDETDVNARITIIDSMIAHLKHKNYIIMGLSNGNSTNRDADDEAMLKHYGNNFFPTRRELVDNGLTVQGLTPTANDLVYINAGTVPESLRIDATHLNAEGYNALGKLLAYKMFSLGFDKIINQ